MHTTAAIQGTHAVAFPELTVPSLQSPLLYCLGSIIQKCHQLPLNLPLLAENISTYCYNMKR